MKPPEQSENLDVKPPAPKDEEANINKSQYEKHKEKLRSLKIEYTKLNGVDENIHKSRSIKEIQSAIDKQKITNEEDKIKKSSKISKKKK